MANRKPRSGKSEPFAALVAEELTESRGEPVRIPAEHNETWVRTTDEEIVGLALSGGGIRSATFNLGLLQGLKRVGLLPALDYLSTVSGGGYIGGFWTAWRRNNPDGEVFPVEADEQAEPAEVRHLREFSNFLSPRLGLLSADTGRIIVAALAAMLPSLAATLSLLVLLMVAWAIAAWAVLAGGPWVRAGALVVLTAVPLLLMERRLRKRESALAAPDGRAAAAGNPLSGAGPWSAALVGTLGVVGAALLLEGATRLATPDGGDVATLGGIAEFVGALPLAGASATFAVALLWLLPVVPILVVRALTARSMTRFGALQFRAAYDRVAARLLLIAGVWLAFASVVWAGNVVVRELIAVSAVGGVTAVLSAIATWLQRQVAEALRSDGIGKTVLARLKPRLPAVLSWLAVFGLAVLVATALSRAQGQVASSTGEPWLIPLIATAIGITALSLFYFDPNRIGLHSFYRGRIARTFLGATNPATAHATHRTTEEARGDDFPIHEAGTRPLHLVCTTANDLAPLDPLASLHRGGRSAVISPVGFTVDRDWRFWLERGKYEPETFLQKQRARLPAEPAQRSTWQRFVAWLFGPLLRDNDAPSLAAALTASAAAFNPMMGSYSMRLGRAVTFLMAALNLRLGRWTKHPSRSGESKTWWFPGVLFYKELLGISSTDGGDVHLSDGGHFENMALYELIRRHCRYIIVSDCGADPDAGFNDLATLMRRVREDFGVELKLDLGALRPDADGRARQPVVIGEVVYPDGDRGTLLLFKPCLVGTEPEDIVQYRRRNPIFPNESTIDQFYDAAQWESYRRLGQHAAETAFEFARGSGPWWPERGADAPAAVLRPFVSRLFGDARFRWLTASPAQAERLVQVSAAAAQLDEALAAPDVRWLARQVHGDVAEALIGLSGNGAGAGQTTPPTPDQIAAGLPVLRNALRFAEDAHRLLGLEEEATHPAHLGIVNLFGRWTGTPLFRLLWPLLRAQHAPAFARFLEGRFAIPERGIAGGDAVSIRADELAVNHGYAVRSWRDAHGADGPPTDANDRFAAYVLTLRYGVGGPETHVHAGLLRYRSIARPGLSPLVTWTDTELYIPPGLWGIGLGGRFLDALLHGSSSPVRNCHVLVTGRDGATGLDLYRQAGFRNVRNLASILTKREDRALVRGVAAGRRFMVRPIDAAFARALAAEATEVEA